MFTHCKKMTDIPAVQIAQFSLDLQSYFTTVNSLLKTKSMKIALSLLLMTFLSPVLFGQPSLTLTNPNAVAVTDAPVVVRLNQFPKIKDSKRQQLTVWIHGKEVSSQLDDLNGDGIPDELVFLADIPANQTIKARLKYVKPNKRNQFPAEVFASLILKDDAGNWNFTNEVSSTQNDMYNRLHHHGVAFETDKMAYRIYFDNKSTIDVYGKKTYRLELPDTYWYPTDEQLAQGYGDDILLVSGWVGVGTVKAWDGKKMQHINNFEKRTQRIVTTGNIRNIVESEVLGWDYEGKKTDMTVRYIQYARHRDVIAEVRTSNDIRYLATGVQQIGGGAFYNSDQLVGSWGSWHPQPDTLKYAKETVGLGLYMNEQYQPKQVIDGVNNLLLTSVKAGEVLKFHFTTVATKEIEQTINNEAAFFRYLRDWQQTLLDIQVR